MHGEATCLSIDKSIKTETFENHSARKICGGLFSENFATGLALRAEFEHLFFAVGFSALQAWLRAPAWELATKNIIFYHNSNLSDISENFSCVNIG